MIQTEIQTARNTPTVNVSPVPVDTTWLLTANAFLSTLFARTITGREPVSVAILDTHFLAPFALPRETRTPTARPETPTELVLTVILASS